MPNYKEILTALNNETDRLIVEQKKIQDRLEHLAIAIRAIEAVAQASGEPIIEPTPTPANEQSGFTDRIRAILRANPFRAITAIQIRDLILQSDPDADPKVTLIHIHNTLKRLVKQDEIEDVDPTGEGPDAYTWKTDRPVINVSEMVKQAIAIREAEKKQKGE